MCPAQSVTSGEGNDGAAEYEFQRLQRAYRLMEAERKTYADEARNTIKKQTRAVEAIKRENEHMVQELALLQHRTEDVKKSRANAERYNALQKKYDDYYTRMRCSAETITSLDDKIEEIGQHIAQQRQLMGGINFSLTSCHAAEKHVRVLENRLDQALIKFNRALTANRKLRNTIDSLRRERLVYDSVYSKLEKELGEQKQLMAEIIESSNNAYEARDEARAKATALADKAEKEYQTYCQEVKELERTLEQDRKLRDFLVTKTADRLDQKSSGVSSLNSNNMVTAGGQNQGLRSSKLKTDLKASSIQELDATGASFEKILAQAKETTGASSLDELIQKFKDAEDQNFSLLNYVNQINSEAEKVAEEVQQLKKKITSISEQAETAQNEDNSKADVIENMMQHTENEISQINSRSLEIEKSICELFSDAQHMMQCFRDSRVTLTSTMPKPTDENEDALNLSSSFIAAAHSAPQGSSSGQQQGPLFGGDECIPALTVNPLTIPKLEQAPGLTIGETLILHLAVLEQKCGDLQMLHQLTVNPRKTASATSSPSMTGSAQPNAEDREGAMKARRRGPSHVIVRIQPPNTCDNDTSEEETCDEMPLTREELAARSIKVLTKRSQCGDPPKKRRQRRVNEKKV